MLTPIIEERCAALLDQVCAHDEGDLARDLCYPLPALTIFAMIGFPAEDSDQIKEWCADKLVVNWGRPTEEKRRSEAPRRWLPSGPIARRSSNAAASEPADDLTTDLMQDKDASEPLTNREIASIVFRSQFRWSRNHDQSCRELHSRGH